MQKLTVGLNNIIKEIINYKFINNLTNDKKLRKREDGISIEDAVLYKLLYANIDTTKDSIAGKLNYINIGNKNNNCFTRQSYESKEQNIPSLFYDIFLNKIRLLHLSICEPKKANELIFVGVDGTSNNDKNFNINLNMGYFDIHNKLPIDLTFEGSENRNKEIESLIKKIKAEPGLFKNTVIVGDRFYFSYDLMTFLDDNGIYFIIRSKDNACILLNDNEIKKTNINYNTITNLKKKVRIVRCTKEYEKVVYSKPSKKRDGTKYTIKTKNKCDIITNLTDKMMYNDDNILNLYRNRWEIETFFKFIKYNFKFQHMSEKKDEQFKRLIKCELILYYLLKIIEKTYIDIYAKNKKKKQINQSLIIDGFFNDLLCTLIYGSLTENKLYCFCKSYMVFIINDSERHFPRNAKEPFKKWYIKGYSISAALVKIIEAINNNKTEELDKNLSLKAKNITIIKIETYK
jgi:hypothetical protein